MELARVLIVPILIDKEHGYVSVKLPEDSRGKPNPIKKIEFGGRTFEKRAEIYFGVTKGESDNKLRRCYPGIPIGKLYEFLEKFELYLIPIAEQTQSILKKNSLCCITTRAKIVFFNGEIVSLGFEDLGRNTIRWHLPTDLNLKSEERYLFA